jgi:hypothetical protein
LKEALALWRLASATNVITLLSAAMTVITARGITAKMETASLFRNFARTTTLALTIAVSTGAAAFHLSPAMTAIHALMTPA